MKSVCYLAALCAVTAALVLSGCEKKPEEAAGPAMTQEEHNEKMVRQHESMMSTQTEWARAKEALESEDAGAVLEPARQMEQQAMALEEFMLHKNPDRREEFLAKAREFKSNLMTFKQYAEKGDVKSLKEIAPEIDRACNGCHQSFR